MLYDIKTKRQGRWTCFLSALALFLALGMSLFEGRAFARTTCYADMVSDVYQAVDAFNQGKGECTTIVIKGTLRLTQAMVLFGGNTLTLRGYGEEGDSVIDNDEDILTLADSYSSSYSALVVFKNMDGKNGKIEMRNLTVRSVSDSGSAKTGGVLLKNVDYMTIKNVKVAGNGRSSGDATEGQTLPSGISITEDSTYNTLTGVSVQKYPGAGILIADSLNNTVTRIPDDPDTSGANEELKSNIYNNETGISITGTSANNTVAYTNIHEFGVGYALKDLETTESSSRNSIDYTTTNIWDANGAIPYGGYTNPYVVSNINSNVISAKILSWEANSIGEYTVIAQVSGTAMNSAKEISFFQDGQGVTDAETAEYATLLYVCEFVTDSSEDTNTPNCSDTMAQDGRIELTFNPKNTYDSITADTSDHLYVVVKTTGDQMSSGSEAVLLGGGEENGGDGTCSGEYYAGCRCTTYPYYWASGNSGETGDTDYDGVVNRGNVSYVSSDGINYYPVSQVVGGKIAGQLVNSAYNLYEGEDINGDCKQDSVNNGSTVTLHTSATPANDVTWTGTISETNAEDPDSDNDCRSDNDEMGNAVGYYVDFYVAANAIEDDADKTAIEFAVQSKGALSIDIDGDRLCDGPVYDTQITSEQTKADAETVALASCSASTQTSGSRSCSGKEDASNYGVYDQGSETNPLDADTDNDGYSDSLEVEYGLNATQVDSDGDGLSDGPAWTDTDGDNHVDIDEWTDTDGDSQVDNEWTDYNGNGQVDSREWTDADGDGQVDNEWTDADGDGHVDIDETGDADPAPMNTANQYDYKYCVAGKGYYIEGQNSDADKLTDEQEDTDLDCMYDVGETSALESDTDGDSINDDLEATDSVNCSSSSLQSKTKTCALAADTDGDLISDGAEDGNQNGLYNETTSGRKETNPLAVDSDGDSIPDGIEDANRDGTIATGTETDPVSPDTDGDGVCDGPMSAANAAIPCSGAEDADHNGQQGTNETDPRDADTDDDDYNDNPASDCNPLNANQNVTCPASYQLAEGDDDGDGLSNAVEDSTPNGRWDADETNFASADTDGDGITDDKESLGARQNPSYCRGYNGTTLCYNAIKADTDGDGLEDGEEDKDGDGQIDVGETDPLDADTDGDGVANIDEDINENGRWDDGETNFANPDTDGDGLTDDKESLGDRKNSRYCRTYNGEERCYSAILADTDGDGVDDGVEDKDLDGTVDPLNSTVEVDDDETDPLNPDTDGDGLDDGLDPAPRNTSDSVDTDGDRIPDSLEDLNRDGVQGANETDPYDSDTDDDGIEDGKEDCNRDGVFEEGSNADNTLETDPLDPDSDGDGLEDGDEYSGNCSFAVGTETNPLLKDTDGDGLTDGQELNIYETDPNNPDSDYDGQNDLSEARGVPQGCSLTQGGMAQAGGASDPTAVWAAVMGLGLFGLTRRFGATLVS